MLPHPLFTFRGYPVSAYLVCLGLAMITGWTLAWVTARRVSIPYRFIWDAWFGSAALAWLGARSWHFLLTVIPGGSAAHHSWSSPDAAGVASIGAIAAFLLALAILVRIDRRIRHRSEAALDCFLPGLAGAEAVARLGCFSAGCCHGCPAYGLPWAVTFPMDSGCSFAGIPVHPTQIYQSLGCGFLALFLYAIAGSNRSSAFPISGLAVYSLGYGALRFVTEGFRGDQSPILAGLSLNQILSLALLGTGLVLVFRHGDRAAMRNREPALTGPLP